MRNKSHNVFGKLGLGIGWRPELALAIDRRRDLGFVEIVAENFASPSRIPKPLEMLRERGVNIVPHGISLSLGGADRPDPARVKHLAALAKRLGAPLVSEHIAFVRAGGIESGHLLPVPRTRAMLDLLVRNISIAKEHLPVPLAMENIATLFEWPDAEMSEAEFLTELLERTDTLFLLDASNAYANARNLKMTSPAELFDRLPLERLAYVHVGGGVERDGIYHDTHADPTPRGALDVLEELCSRATPMGAMLERDSNYPREAEIHRELDDITEAARRGARKRGTGLKPVHATRSFSTRSSLESCDHEQTQVQLVRTLTLGESTPSGFNPANVTAAARSLASKRARSAARAYPRLAEAMKGDFQREFMAYALIHPLPASGGAGADVREFARWLGARQDLSDEIRRILQRDRLSTPGRITKWTTKLLGR